MTRQEHLNHQNRVGSELLSLIKRNSFFVAKFFGTECTEFWGLWESRATYEYLSVKVLKPLSAIQTKMDTG